MREQRHRAVFRRWLCGGREDYFKEAAQRKASIERIQEAAEERKQQMEIAYRKQAMAEFFCQPYSRYEQSCIYGYTGRVLRLRLVRKISWKWAF